MVHRIYGFGDRNEASMNIIDFIVTCDFIIENSYFKKRDEHFIIFKSGSNDSQIDFFLTRKMDKIACKDYKVILEGSITLQYNINHSSHTSFITLVKHKW